MTDLAPVRVWGRQHPFERNHLQRSMLILSAFAELTVALVIVGRRRPLDELAVVLLGGGACCAAAAYSRARYEAEMRAGFSVLRRRSDARFVALSSVVLTATAVMTLLLIATS